MHQLQVKASGNVPRSFSWRGKTYMIESIIERWKDTGRWWQDETPKYFFRVKTADGGLWEIYLDTGSRLWFLYKIYD